MALNQITKMRLSDGREVAFVDWTDKPLYSTIEILSGTTTQEMNFFQYTVGDSVPAFAPVAVTAQRTADQIDTNMAAPGAMASTEEMLVYAIRPEIWRRHVASFSAPNFAAPEHLNCVPIQGQSCDDGIVGNEPTPNVAMLSVLAHRTLLSLEISQKVFAQAGFGYFNTGFGPVGIGGIETTMMGNQGWQSQDAVRAFAIPQHIGGQEKFRVFMTYLDDGTGAGLEVGQLNSDEGSSLSPEGSHCCVVKSVFARIRVNLDGLYKRPVS